MLECYLQELSGFCPFLKGPLHSSLYAPVLTLGGARHCQFSSQPNMNYAASYYMLCIRRLCTETPANKTGCRPQVGIGLNMCLNSLKSMWLNLSFHCPELEPWRGYSESQTGEGGNQGSVPGSATDFLYGLGHLSLCSSPSVKWE